MNTNTQLILSAYLLKRASAIPIPDYIPTPVQAPAKGSQWWENIRSSPPAPASLHTINSPTRGPLQSAPQPASAVAPPPQGPLPRWQQPNVLQTAGAALSAKAPLGYSPSMNEHAAIFGGTNTQAAPTAPATKPQQFSMLQAAPRATSGGGGDWLSRLGRTAVNMVAPTARLGRAAGTFMSNIARGQSGISMVGGAGNYRPQQQPNMWQAAR
jgi:hypothetical protein